MVPSRLAAVLITILVLTAGCLGGIPSPSDDPAPNKEVRLENRWNQSVEVDLRVVRQTTNETVHEETYTLESDEERVAYNVSAADPQGVESFRVVASARNETGRTTIETNACYGNAHVAISEEGNFSVFHSIC